MNNVAFAFWMLVAIGLTVSRFLVVGELDNSPSSLYKDAAHLLFGGAFVYACCKWNAIDYPLPYDATKGDEADGAKIRVIVLFAMLALSLVAEVGFAFRDNFQGTP